MAQRHLEVPPELLGRVYDAALDARLWDSVMAGVERFVGADSSALYMHDSREQQASFDVIRKLDQSRMRDYYSHFYRIDPYRAKRDKLPVGTVLASHKALSDAALRRTEYYQDFFRHLGCFYAAGGVIFRDPTRSAVFSVQRRENAGRFGERDLRKVEALLPHMQRAFQIGRHMAGQETERQALLAVLERLPTGVMLLDADGRVAFVNSRAQAMLASADGLTVSREGLVASDPAIHSALLSLMAAATRTGAGFGVHPGGGVCVTSADGRESIQVLVTPLRTERVRVNVGRSPICAAVFLHLRGAAPMIESDVLRDLFGLTQAEARVAVALVHGRNPEEIAGDTDTSRFTVRAQLSSVYEKVGVRRQAELVQRVLTSPAILANGNGDDG